ncbi:MAG: tetratricopeptide repeat protein [Planctomycetaceae bacterium]|nr:tetratricopeptide repeat protein [Planctomycetaceae bacterium]
MRRLRGLLALVATGTLLVGGAGCAHVGNYLGLKSQDESEVQRAAFEEEIPDAPPDPKNPSQLKLAYARWMEESGNVDEARNQYTAVRSEEPKNVDAILGLARVDLASGKHVEAEQGFQRALKLDPESPLAHHGLARCYAVQKRWTEAVAELNTAVLADPTNNNFRYDLAVAMAHTGDIDGALPHFVRVVGDAKAHYNVGLILQDEGQTAAAKKHLSLALTKDPHLEEAEHWLRRIQAAEPNAMRSPQHSLSQQPAPSRDISLTTATQREQRANQHQAGSL